MGPGGCVARWSSCKVNDGFDVSVAVEVNVWVKVIVEDKVKLRRLPRAGSRRAARRNQPRIALFDGLSGEQCDDPSSRGHPELPVDAGDLVRDRPGGGTALL